MNVWGIHMGEKVGSSPVDDNYVAIGWKRLGNLSSYSISREKLKQALANTYPDIKKGAIPDIDSADDDSVTEAISHQAEQTTEDFIIKQLHAKLDGYEFEEFVAHILVCMGYKARVSSKSGDGGVDVIAHKDELGFEPPIIKVQCKKSLTSNGEPEVNQLLGALSDGEYGLFVNLGSYSRPARLLERNKAKLRLIDGDELVDLVLEHYINLSPKYRALLPLKQIYVADLG